MHTLPLAPLPRETRDESDEFRRIRSEGFIDEQAVAQVIARGAYERTPVQPAGMVLSACGDDYAGWMPPVKSPFREMTGSPPLRQPPPPMHWKGEEPGIETAYRGGHRWWLLGMAGAMTCGIMAITLFSLAPHHEMAGLAITPASGKVETPDTSGEKPDFRPPLTKVLSEKR